MSFRLHESVVSPAGSQIGGAGRRESRAAIRRPLRPGVRKRGMGHLSVLAATVFLSTPSSAADYAVRDIGRWTVSPSSDGQGCFITRTYPGQRGTTLLFGLDVDGSNRLTMLNANWSVREREELRLNFRLSNASFPRHLAVGIAANGRNGFVTSFGKPFPGTFAAARFLHVSRGDVPVEELSLEGSGAAVAELRTCVRLHGTSPAAAGPARKDGSRIPIDPFAADAGSKRRK